MAKDGKFTAQIDLQLRIGGKRIIILDIDTGDWILPVSITGEEGARLAAAVLPGWPAEEIDKAYSEWMRDDPAPVPVALVDMITSDKYGHIPFAVYIDLAAAQVTTDEFERLRADYGNNWLVMLMAVREATDATGVYRTAG